MPLKKAKSDSADIQSAFEVEARAADTYTLRVFTYADGHKYYADTGAVEGFRLGIFTNDEFSTAGVIITGAVHSTSNFVDFRITAADAPTPGTYFLQVAWTNGTPDFFTMTFGEGALEAARNPIGGSPTPAILTSVVNWDSISNVGTVPWIASADIDTLAKFNALTTDTDAFAVDGSVPMTGDGTHKGIDIVNVPTYTDLVLEGEFDTSTKWNIGANWAISGGDATYTSTDPTDSSVLSQVLVGMVAGRYYQLVFDFDCGGLSELSLEVSLGNANNPNLTLVADNYDATFTHTFQFAGVASLEFLVAGGPAGAETASIDNVIVYDLSTDLVLDLNGVPIEALTDAVISNDNENRRRQAATATDIASLTAGLTSSNAPGVGLRRDGATLSITNAALNTNAFNVGASSNIQAIIFDTRGRPTGTLHHADANTTYTAGAHLRLDGAAFSISNAGAFLSLAGTSASNVYEILLDNRGMITGSLFTASAAGDLQAVTASGATTDIKITLTNDLVLVSNIVDTAGHKILAAKDGEQALYYDGGSVMFMDLGTSYRINWQTGPVFMDMGTTFSMYDNAGNLFMDLGNGTEGIYFNNGLIAIDLGITNRIATTNGIVLVDLKTGLITNATVALVTGATVNEFSIDGTLAGNSDTAVPTEKAVKTYVDAAGGGGDPAAWWYATMSAAMLNIPDSVETPIAYNTIAQTNGCNYNTSTYTATNIPNGVYMFRLQVRIEDFDTQKWGNFVFNPVGGFPLTALNRYNEAENQTADLQNMSHTAVYVVTNGNGACYPAWKSGDTADDNDITEVYSYFSGIKIHDYP